MSSQPRTLSRLSGPATANPNATHGSQTIVHTPAGPADTPSATLRLRAEPQENSHVRWATDVVDNEGMGKKSSKVCCIYHKPKEPGDSDSDSDSSSSEDGSESEPDLSRAQKAGGGRGGRRARSHGGKGKGTERKPSPNAYERQPRSQGKKE
nr:type 1 phosphatases regulator ypi1 [Quercus suber]